MARELSVVALDPSSCSDAALLEEVCDAMVARLRNKDRRFQISVLQTHSLDLFSLPGGFIFVDVSLLDFCRHHRDQLAFAVGHEIGHVIRRHAIDRWVAAAGINAISTLVNRSAAAAWWQQQGKEWLRSAYTHEQEKEADEFGFRLARAAGYDPGGASRFLERLHGLRATPGTLGEHLASHPLELQRIAWLREVLHRLERRAGA